MAMNLTDQNFDQEVKQFDGVVLVDFFAPWCGPCQMQAPIIDELAKEFSANDKVKIVKIDVDQSKTTASEFPVMSIPTLKIFKNGQVVDETMGLQNKDALVEKINQHLK